MAERAADLLFFVVQIDRKAAEDSWKSRRKSSTELEKTARQFAEKAVKHFGFVILHKRRRTAQKAKRF